MIELAKDVLFSMLLLPVLLVVFAVQILLEAVQDWWGNIHIPSSSTSASTSPRLVASAGLSRS